MEKKSWLSSLKDFDPEKDIFELPSFKFVFWLFIIPAIISTAAIMMNATVLPFDWTYLGFNKFAVIYKVPISIITFMLAIMALLATNHRSAQSKKQIEVSNAQNIFTNYYKHLEEFEKYVSKISGGQVKYSEIRGLHTQIFPNMKTNGNDSVSKTITNWFDVYISKIDSGCSDDSFIIHHNEFIDMINLTCCILTPDSLQQKNPITGLPLEKPSVQSSRLLNINIKSTVILVNQILSFDSRYSPSEFVLSVLES